MIENTLVCWRSSVLSIIIRCKAIIAKKPFEKSLKCFVYIVVYRGKYRAHSTQLDLNNQQSIPTSSSHINWDEHMSYKFWIQFHRYCNCNATELISNRINCLQRIWSGFTSNSGHANNIHLYTRATIAEQNNKRFKRITTRILHIHRYKLSRVETHKAIHCIWKRQRHISFNVENERNNH